MTPCKAFGHTEGRTEGRSCIVCQKMRGAIKNTMKYWFKRIILGLSGTDARSGNLEKHRESMRKYMRYIRTERDQATISKLVEASPWLRKLL